MAAIVAAGIAHLATAANAGAELELLEVARELRAGGCAGRPGTTAPLRRRGELDALARSLASQPDLRAALNRSSLAIMEAAALRVDGADSREQLRQLVSERFCDRLVQPPMRDAGVHQNGRTIWLVVAQLAPSATSEGRGDVVMSPLPAETDAPSRAARSSRTPAAEAQRALALINEARSRPRRCGTRDFPAAGSLRWSATLERAARAHARDMAQRNFFEHRGSDGSNHAQRVARTGYRWLLTGENLAYGPGSAERVVAGWLASPGHCANIMQARYTETGIAIERDRDGTALYWAQSFALPRAP